MRNVVYQSTNYKPELVTGRYVLCTGSKRKGYVFRVFECASGTGRFAGVPGRGGTLREYDCDGAELPDEIKARCIASKHSEELL